MPHSYHSQGLGQGSVCMTSGLSYSCLLFWVYCMCRTGTGTGRRSLKRLVPWECAANFAVIVIVRPVGLDLCHFWPNDIRTVQCACNTAALDAEPISPALAPSGNKRS